MELDLIRSKLHIFVRFVEPHEDQWAAIPLRHETVHNPKNSWPLYGGNFITQCKPRPRAGPVFLCLQGIYEGKFSGDLQVTVGREVHPGHEITMGGAVGCYDAQLSLYEVWIELACLMPCEAGATDFKLLEY